MYLIIGMCVQLVLYMDDENLCSMGQLLFLLQLHLNQFNDELY